MNGYWGSRIRGGRQQCREGGGEMKVRMTEVRHYICDGGVLISDVVNSGASRGAVCNCRFFVTKFTSISKLIGTARWKSND